MMNNSTDAEKNTQLTLPLPRLKPLTWSLQKTSRASVMSVFLSGSVLGSDADSGRPRSVGESHSG